MDRKRRRLERLSACNLEERDVQRRLADQFRREGQLLNAYICDWRAGNTNPDCPGGSPTMHELKESQTEWLKQLPGFYKAAFDPVDEPAGWVSISTARASSFPTFALRPGFQFHSRQIDLITGFRILRTLDLSWTSLTDEDLAQLVCLERLQNLNLSYTQVGNACFETLREFENLERLRLAESQITTDGLQGIGQLKALRTLTLARIDTDGETARRFYPFVKQLVSINSLEHLELSNVTLDHCSMAGLTRLSNLKTLRIWNSGTRLSQRSRLDKFTNLRTLDLSGNPLTDHDLRQLSQLRNLQSLSLSRTKITDKGLEHICGLPQLRYLDLSDCHISGSGLSLLAKLPALSSLLLDRCHLKAGRLRALSRLQNLEKLSLSCNPITDNDLEPLSNLPRLYSLDLSGIHDLDEAIYPILANLPALRLLNLKFTRAALLGDCQKRHLEHVNITT